MERTDIQLAFAIGFGILLLAILLIIFIRVHKTYSERKHRIDFTLPDIDSASQAVMDVKEAGGKIKQINESKVRPEDIFGKVEVDESVIEDFEKQMLDTRERVVAKHLPVATFVETEYTIQTKSDFELDLEDV